MTINHTLLFSLNYWFLVSLFAFAGFRFTRLRSGRDPRRTSGKAPQPDER